MKLGREHMEYYLLSKTGDREINEDSAAVYETDRGFVCIVADGLGGHERGEVASTLVKEEGITLFAQMSKAASFSLETYLKQCFQDGQQKLLQLQRETAGEMKTTMVVLASMDDCLQWGHIGDSRLYQFQRGKLVRRTLDHSVPQLLVMSGEIKEKQIRGHEDRNRLLRVMGTEWTEPKYELAEQQEAQDGQAYLLCSDGFWELIEEKKMEKCLRRAKTPKEWVELMEQEMLRDRSNNDRDNYTAIAVFLGEPAPKRGWFHW